eukprot:scaffold15065_cov140-Isochrysis_galbana.AAC.6
MMRGVSVGVACCGYRRVPFGYSHGYASHPVSESGECLVGSREARLRCGRGQVRVVWRRACREHLAPGLVCRRSVSRS